MSRLLTCFSHTLSQNLRYCPLKKKSFPDHITNIQRCPPALNFSLHQVYSARLPPNQNSPVESRSNQLHFNIKHHNSTSSHEVLRRKRRIPSVYFSPLCYTLSSSQFSSRHNTSSHLCVSLITKEQSKNSRPFLYFVSF